MSVKRSLPASEDVPSTLKPAQKPRLSQAGAGATTSILSIDRAALEQLPQETLVNYGAKPAAALAERPAAVTNAASEDPKAVEAMAAKLARMMATGIEKQMKWQPSCKNKGKRFAYDAMVPSPAVFYKLFNLQPEKKEWKQKKIPKEEFQKITGSITASIRYGYLSITGSDITVKWDREGSSFTVSGLYGL